MTKFAPICVLIALLVATSTNASQLLERESQALSVELVKMEKEFEETVKLIFWSNRNSADMYAHMAGREQEGKELLNMAQVATFIESIKFAIKHKALSVLRQAIESQRWTERGIVLHDNKLQVDLRPPMLSALVARVVMRSHADAERFTAPYWGRLYHLIEHNSLAYPRNPSFRLVAVNSYQQLMKLRMDLQQARENYERILFESLNEMQIDLIQSKHIQDSLDQMIEDLLECSSCSQKPLDNLKTRPLFDNESAIQRALGEHVDRKLQAAIMELEGVFEVSLEEQDRVTRADLEAQMQRVIDGL